MNGARLRGLTSVDAITSIKERQRLRREKEINYELRRIAFLERKAVASLKDVQHAKELVRELALIEFARTEEKP